MNRKHVDKTENNSRERLLIKAISLFAKKGYAATTVREIVRESSTTAPSLYYHFGSKEGLFRTLVEIHFNKISDVLDHFENASFDSTREKIKNLMYSAFSIIIENREFFLILNAFYYGPPNNDPLFDFDSFMARFHNVLIRIFKEGIKSGEFKNGDASDMAWVVRGVMRVVIDDQIRKENRSIDKRMLSKLMDLVLDGFANPPQNKKPRGETKVKIRKR